MVGFRKRKIEETECDIDFSESEAYEKKFTRWQEHYPRKKLLQSCQQNWALRTTGGGRKRDYWEYSSEPPSERWFNEREEFQIPSSKISFLTPAEEKERRRVSRIDFASRNVDYILRLSEKLRGGYYQCVVDENEPFVVGSRNYIVTLLFDDGTKWLLKTAQPHHEWDQMHVASPEFMVREIATNLWVFENTGIPVPQIRLWDTRTTKENKFGRPWYVMHKVEGKTLNKCIGATVWLGLDQAQLEMAVHQQLARFALDLLKHPSGQGRYQLKKKASFFHGSGNPPSQVAILKSAIAVGSHDQPNLTSSIINALDRCTAALDQNLEYLGSNGNEINLHARVLGFLKEIIPKIVDSRFESTYYLYHKDLTEDNIICDSDSYITGIIDWEVARTIPLQELIAQPTTIDNQLLRMATALFNQTGDLGIVADEWKKYDADNQILRDFFIIEFDRLDDSVMGDQTTPWTAGYKYISGLYRIAHALQMIRFFSEDYKRLLKEEQDVRMFVLLEIEKIAKRAVRLVERDGVFMRAGP
ncbi:hypothetical protein TWF106_000987 [Orbilia oligospora]|uniref:Aminoglycoside phosphotransferase domain-containing protein n=2 Tax=Orbilia oligospora TaxID=2813651 RepID=A0A6G1M572_ORBOL|nr:hypothetical protein TWF106_000987 [Orbilia oligospora]KAF3216516.1 hypothetical protein TWF191_009004 [Orbilia oligospora]KAF3245026.1 hypothetical protein TWF192_007549 [Orbilia oligospora]